VAARRHDALDARPVHGRGPHGGADHATRLRHALTPRDPAPPSVAPPRTDQLGPDARVTTAQRVRRVRRLRRDGRMIVPATGAIGHAALIQQGAPGGPAKRRDDQPRQLVSAPAGLRASWSIGS
jgi:hypothetical protein